MGSFGKTLRSILHREPKDSPSSLGLPVLSLPKKAPEIKGTSAAEALRVLLLRIIVSLLLLGGLLVLLAQKESPFPFIHPLVPLCLMIFGVPVWAEISLRKIGLIHITEMGYGYTTLRWNMSRWWGLSKLPESNAKDKYAGVVWDWDNIWVLNHKGKIVREPDWDGDPPGFYLSLKDPDVEELWSGRTWTGLGRLIAD